MATVKIGRVTLGFSGEWNALSTYVRLETVTYQGSTWVALQDVPAGVEPSIVNAVYWSLAAQKGDKGDQGEQGIQGPVGPMGPEGPAGADGADGASDWTDIQNKPQTATRWPLFSEVQSVPDTATRWPTWDEVVDKPTEFPVSAESHDHTRIVEYPAYTTPFDNAANTPRAFFSVGLCVSFVQGTQGWPTGFGRLINIPSYTNAQDGGAFQIWIPYSASYNGGKIQWRTGLFDNTGWTAWVTPATADELTAVQSTLSDAINTKLNTTAYTAEDVLSKLLNVDGTGSGLDADLLDGQQGSYYYSPANPPPAGAPTAGQVGSAIASMAWNAVGSYVMARYVGNKTINQTQAGSGLVPCTTDADNSGGSTTSGSALTGTWRCMGYNYQYNVSFGTGNAGTIWKRIS